MWISKQEYDESGPSIVHRKCFWFLLEFQIFTQINTKRLIYDILKFLVVFWPRHL
jgi:hypothetical protein